MSLPMTAFLRPDGKKQEIICNFITDDDANFFKTRSVKVSMEEDGSGGYILYADYGAVNEDGEPDEIIVFSGARTCETSMTELREMTEKAMAS